MQAESLTLLPLAAGLLAGALALIAAALLARRTLARARSRAAEALAEAEQEARNRKKEILVAAQENVLALKAESDRRDQELEERERSQDKREQELGRQAGKLRGERKRLEQQTTEIERTRRAASEAHSEAEALRQEARDKLEHVAGISAEKARAELIAGIEEQARAQGARLARKIEEEARAQAERQAMDLMVRASQHVNIRDVLESTVSFIELPSDEMKGRIIGREGRNIRALEMATGIDLIVDDTPRSILISSFDPVRREVARVAIGRLVEDGRIHPARIEEVVQKVGGEIEELIEEKGAEAAYGLSISDLHRKLARLVGRMRYHTYHGQNLLQHCLETAMIAGHMAREIGARVEVAQRAGLLHEIGSVDDTASSHPILASAELCVKYREPEAVVHAIRSLHSDVDSRSVEAVLVHAANRMSENRPGARKENLAVFIERLRRLENIASGFDGVDRVFAVKAGKEIRVIVDAKRTSDQGAYALCKEIARAVERELSYPGQIKVSVIRETRAVQFAV